jgi:hypothetical protein
VEAQAAKKAAQKAVQRPKDTTPGPSTRPTAALGTTGGWRAVARSRQTPPKEVKKDCWLFLYDFTSHSTHQQSYRGNTSEWRETLRKQLGSQATHLQGCVMTSSPDGDRRIAIEAPDKAMRRQLLVAVKNSRGKVRCSPYLSPSEKQAKSHVYRLAHRLNVHVEDRGDMVVIKPKSGGGLFSEATITLDMPKEEVTKQF